MRFITLAMATGVHQDKTVIRLQDVDVSMSRPALHAPRHPVLQDQGRALPLDSIVDSDALVGRVWHDVQLVRSLGLGFLGDAAERCW